MQPTYSDYFSKTKPRLSEELKLVNGQLFYNHISLLTLVEKYGSPLRVTYLPKITQQIKKAKSFFNNAFLKLDYKGKYSYAYCTKCNHFGFVIEKALQSNISLETSSELDIDIILNLFKRKKIDKNITVINNGYKSDRYLQKIIDLIRLGFKNVLIILDSENELERLTTKAQGQKINIGIRMAIDEPANSKVKSSRMGIPSNQIVYFYEKKIKTNPNLSLKMLHFFVDTGMDNSDYYWSQFEKGIELYTILSKACNSLTDINIGGGFPIANALEFVYDYNKMTLKIVQKIKQFCGNSSVKHPNIYTEFGTYTVGESGITLVEVIEKKVQNNKETWYLIDNSFMNLLPDQWSGYADFILLPVNRWDFEFQKVELGGISCDHTDIFQSKKESLVLPKIKSSEKSKLVLAFFNTGAYQDALSGYGGYKHCLIPTPKQLVLDIDNKGKTKEKLFIQVQSTQNLLDTIMMQKS